MNSGLSPLQHSRQLLRQGPVQASHGKSTATSNPSALTARTLSTHPASRAGEPNYPTSSPAAFILTAANPCPFRPSACATTS
jgi:hypothetical protein